MRLTEKERRELMAFAESATEDEKKVCRAAFDEGLEAVVCLKNINGNVVVREVKFDESKRGEK